MAGVDERTRRGLPLWRRGNLEQRPFPSFDDMRYADRSAVLEALRQWAEAQAEDAIAWYLRDKSIKRVGSRALRATAIALGVAGGMVPLLTAAASGGVAGWGYVLLGAAAGCLAFDHFFGLSSGWMRDMAAAQALQRALTEFRLEWMSMDLRADGPGPAEDVIRRQDLIRSLVTAVADTVQTETAEWLTEFRTTLGHLRSNPMWTAGGHDPVGGGLTSPIGPPTGAASPDQSAN